MEQRWQLQDAKNRFSEVVENAMNQGPQVVTKHGKEAVVIISIKEYRKIKEPADSLIDFFKASPLNNLNLDLERDKEYPREVEL
jgi:antitoxin Phd